VLLFGSHARGTAQLDSDYDFIIVSPRFAGVHPFDRARGLKDLFYEVGGPAPMDLICLTPEEFENATHHITLVAAVLPEAIDLLPPETVKTAQDDRPRESDADARSAPSPSGRRRG
jgi:hypothetical protein